MARQTSKKNSEVEPHRLALSVNEALSREDSIGGVHGPGRWLVVEYQPTTLFSLKSSQATSSVGASLIIPTPYAIKMALVDTAFRSGLKHEECEQFFCSLAKVDIRISPASASVVTSTFVKVRQESRPPTWDKKNQKEEDYRNSLIQKLCSEHPAFTPDECKMLDTDAIKGLIESTYTSTIAYRELVHTSGVWRWAFDLAYGDDLLGKRVAYLAPYISYIGKRGSFVRFVRLYRQLELGVDFTQVIEPGASLQIPKQSHVRLLDDFGPEADLPTLSSYSPVKPKTGKHRRFLQTIIPIGVSNSGPGFTEYRGEQP